MAKRPGRELSDPNIDTPARRSPATGSAGAGAGAQGAQSARSERAMTLRLPDPCWPALEAIVAQRGVQIGAYVRDAVIEALIYDGALPADFVRPHVKRGRPTKRARQSEHGSEANETTAE